MSDPEPPPPTYWEQPERVETKSDGSKSITKTYKGDYGDLAAFAGGLTIGTSTASAEIVGTGEPVDLPLRSINLTRTVADLAVLKLEYGKDDNNDGEGSAEELSESWAMKHTQRIVSLMKRTGASASMPSRGCLEAWSKEPDPALYDAYQYRNQVGNVMTLTPDEITVAQKLEKGVTGAMRFYPTVQHVRQYGRGKITGVGGGLAYISEPGSPWDSVATSWLKVGDDVSFDVAKGVQTRTETWIGAASWDVNLYGSVEEGRWTELDGG